MLKRAFLILVLILSFSFSTLAFQQDNGQNNPQPPPENSTPKSDNPLDKFLKIDDIGVLRLLYPKESLSYKSLEDEPNQPSPEQHYQVGDIETHKVAVLSRTLGKFSQTNAQEMLAFIGVDTGNDKNASIPTGTYVVLFKIGDSGAPELITRSKNLQQKGSPFINKIWQPLLTTDINFDKQDDLVIVQGEKKGKLTYSIYSWEGKDFSLVSDHPAIALLSYYSNLNAAASLGLEGEDAPGKNELSAAYEKLSPKMQGQQTAEVLRRRLNDVKAVELNNLKVMIKSETSALIRIQYRLIDTDGFKQIFEGDYQIKRLADQWQLDSERLKSVNLAK